MKVMRAASIWPRSAMGLCGAAVMLGLSASFAQADSLAETATNPIGNLVQLQFQDRYNWSNYNSDGASNAAIVQPVIPFKLPWDDGLSARWSAKVNFTLLFPK